MLWSVIAVVVTLVILCSRALLLQWGRLFILAWKLPCPKTMPLFGNMWDFKKPTYELLDFVTSQFNKDRRFYAVWIGPVPLLFVREPEHLEAFLGSTKSVEKPFVYLFLEPGLINYRGEKWHFRRKLVTPTFHMKMLEQFHEIFCKKSEILVKKLDEQINGKPVNVQPYLSKCLLDIIAATAMGTEINSQETLQIEGLELAAHHSMRLIFERMISPWRYFECVYRFLPSGREHYKWISILRNQSLTVVRERKKSRLADRKNDKAGEEDEVMGRKKKIVFIDMLLEASENGQTLTDDDIKEDVLTFMAAGHETTTTGISWFLQLVGNNFDIQSKVHEELDSIFQGSDRAPTMQDLNDMKYTERALKETLRMYPSIPLIARVVNEDIQLDGHTVPAGMIVLLLMYSTHRHADLYPEPEKFDPDRFLPEEISKRHPYSYLPFSAGPKNCIGYKFAMIEMKTMLAYILRRFSVRATRKTLKPLPALTLHSEEGFYIVFDRRNPCT